MTYPIEELKQLLSSPKKCAIIPHYNPDGDAMGSTLALKMFLQKQGHEAEVVTPNDFPKFLKWLPEAKKTIIADYNFGHAYKAVVEADLIFLLDFNDLSRINNLGEVVEKQTVPKILIDHHQQPNTFDLMFSDTKQPATCQILYQIFQQMDALEIVDEEIATCLYTGIMTDTGGFRHPTTTSETHRIVADLMDKGADGHQIHVNVWDQNTENRYKLLGRALERITVFPEHQTCYTYLTRKDLEDLSFEKGDTEGFVNYGLSMMGIQFSVIFIEDLKQDFIKISFRSQGDFDVNEFARKHFNGGGHINAAGGRSEENMQNTIKNFVDLLADYQSELHA